MPKNFRSTETIQILKSEATFFAGENRAKLIGSFQSPTYFKIFSARWRFTVGARQHAHFLKSMLEQARKLRAQENCLHYLRYTDCVCFECAAWFS